MSRLSYFPFLTFYLLLAGGMVTFSAPQSNLTLRVDLSDTLRPVTHCASGSLYGITESLPADIIGLLAPLNSHVFTQPARAGSGFQQPIGAALPVSQRITSTSAKVMIRLADVCPGWPYRWPGKSRWVQQVTSVINDKKASARNNYYGYEIWNESDGTWQQGNGEFTTVLWKPTYELIRSLDSGAKIIGPSDAYYNHGRMKTFLSFCKNNNCIPDIMCWHALQGCANFTKNVKDYRALEKELGIPELPISINEYCHNDKPKEGCPGTSASFIAKFERNKIESACISWWFTNLPGRLGSLLTSSNQKGGGWWFYKWYGDMTGNMVKVVPPNENSEGIDGFACIDLEKRYASICFGGNNTGTVNVVISGFPSSFEKITTKVEYVPWTNKDTPVIGPTAVSTKNGTVINGTLTVPVNVTSQLYGYRVYIQADPAVEIRECNHSTVLDQITISKNFDNRFLTISLPGKSETGGNVTICNMLGMMMYSNLISALEMKVNIGNLTSGLYVIKVNSHKRPITRIFYKK
ncbi:MAG: T9SS type A sorting domain-containing protein [Chitinispirillaceae bacterium]|nr:T9SS type A sorting domain-containing protein [Chitinispirillaceae bacterium]